MWLQPCSIVPADQRPPSEKRCHVPGSYVFAIRARANRGWIACASLEGCDRCRRSMASAHEAFKASAVMTSRGFGQACGPRGRKRAVCGRRSPRDLAGESSHVVPRRLRRTRDGGSPSATCRPRCGEQPAVSSEGDSGIGSRMNSVAGLSRKPYRPQNAAGHGDRAARGQCRPPDGTTPAATSAGRPTARSTARAGSGKCGCGQSP